MLFFKIENLNLNNDTDKNNYFFVNYVSNTSFWWHPLLTLFNLHFKIWQSEKIYEKKIKAYKRFQVKLFESLRMKVSYAIFFNQENSLFGHNDRKMKHIK